MCRNIKLPAILFASTIFAFGILAAPINPAQALGHDSLRSVIGQALAVPGHMIGQANKMTGQPLMMVQDDMMRGMRDMPGPGRMMGGGMMGMMNMMTRMSEMMGQGGMMGQMGEMMEQCNEMMKGMTGGERPNEQWRDRDEPRESPQQ